MLVRFLHQGRDGFSEAIVRDVTVFTSGTRRLFGSNCQGCYSLYIRDETAFQKQLSGMLRFSHQGQDGLSEAIVRDVTVFTSGTRRLFGSTRWDTMIWTGWLHSVGALVRILSYGLEEAALWEHSLEFFFGMVETGRLLSVGALVGNFSIWFRVSVYFDLKRWLDPVGAVAGSALSLISLIRTSLVGRDSETLTEWE